MCNILVTYPYCWSFRIANMFGMIFGSLSFGKKYVWVKGLCFVGFSKLIFCSSFIYICVS